MSFGLDSDYMSQVFEQWGETLKPTEVVSNLEQLFQRENAKQATVSYDAGAACMVRVESS